MGGKPAKRAKMDRSKQATDTERAKMDKQTTDTERAKTDKKVTDKKVLRLIRKQPTQK